MSSRVNFLTSGFPNGFSEEFIARVKPHVHGGSFVFAASHFDSYEKTDRYARLFVHFFEEKGVCFSNLTVVDHRISREQAHEAIAGADVLWLSGGNTLQEMGYFNEYDLASALQKRQGLTIGMSAGSINMAKRVVLSRDRNDEIPELSVYEGLGLVEINVEPHANAATPDHWEEVFEASRLAPIYCLYDGSFIEERDGELLFFGRCDLAREGKLTTVCAG